MTARCVIGSVVKSIRVASWGGLLAIEVRELLALRGETFQQRRRRPYTSVLLLELRNSTQHTFQANRVRIPHWSATVCREAVAVDINDVDVAGPQCDSLLQYLCTFIDQRIDRSLDY